MSRRVKTLSELLDDAQGERFDCVNLEVLLSENP
jgi:hypothetical protein